MYRSVIVATDGSSYVEELLPCVQQIAGGSGANVVLVQAVKAPREIGAAEKHLDQIASHLGENVSIDVRQDGVCQAVRDHLESDPDSLAAIAIRGHSALRETLMGSEALGVAR